MSETELSDEYDIESKKKALIIVRDAFEACEKQGVSGVMAVGAFLDHILFHLVSMNDREMTASFLEALASKVTDGVYDLEGELGGEGAEGVAPGDGDEASGEGSNGGESGGEGENQGG